MKNDKTYQQTGLVLDLKEIIWNLLSQWKAVVLSALIIAVMVCGAKYMKDIKAYNVAVAAQQEAAEEMRLSTDERIEKALSMVPEEEQVLVNYITKEQEWINEQKKYLQESILMKTDPTNQRVLKLTYSIEPADEKMKEEIIDNYYLLIRSEKMLNAVKEIIAPYANNKYISELFYETEKEQSATAIYDNQPLLKVNIVLPEDADIESVSRAIKTVVSEHSEELQKKSPHSIALTAEEESRVFHENNVQNRTEIFYSINNLEASIKNVQGMLTDSQKTAIATINDIKVEAVASEKEKGDELFQYDTDVTKDANQSPKWSKKYAALGLILGVFLYSCIYIVQMILRKIVGSVAAAEHYTQARTLGELYFEDEIKGLKVLFHSKPIEKAHCQGKHSLDIQIKKTADTIASICERKKIRSILFLNIINMAGSKKQNECIQLLTDCVEGKAINTEIIDAGKDFTEKKLLGVRNSILLISADTNVASLRNIIRLCNEYGISIAGNVYIAPVLETHCLK